MRAVCPRTCSTPQLLRRERGLTLMEGLLAMAILAVAVLGLSQLAAARHAHLKQGDLSLRAIQLAEHLMEEIAARPYEGTGVTRSDWCMGDYEGFTQQAGEVTDFAGTPYSGADALFTRRVTMADASATVPQRIQQEIDLFFRGKSPDE